ncbi:MAG: hypothetical protein GFH27_549307n133 [Chloroflexi bacterium AL-W]|nr:hypothetical protein [Chloroflexi bacterium AL-N1]NOK69165.1 hypothetical protein [Chloroflexi bacterium AL-N10]NOK77148.1 hypothetical protein [Chloroflexi bacterium AL-N5]NOK83793.1 hypothetical protein [Chloroflexi bacterium AL-W]NOK91003.1 hypothetical protein [Chloroflexi bacterium AL-N15]
MSVNYNHDQIRAALALTNPAISAYFDLQTGNVVYVNETDTSPENEQLRNVVMESYGERYRYISGGNPAADAAAVAAWLEGEGL